VIFSGCVHIPALVLLCSVATMVTPGSSQVQSSHATAVVGTAEDKAMDVVHVSEGGSDNGERLCM